jgi:hypothetical protein
MCLHMDTHSLHNLILHMAYIALFTHPQSSYFYVSLVVLLIHVRLILAAYVAVEHYGTLAVCLAAGVEAGERTHYVTL